jgi:uncharacterized protein YjdB
MRLIPLLALALLASCGGTSDTPSQPTAGVASVVVNGAATVRIGQTIRLTATALDANGQVISGKTFAWSSANETVATVASDGIVTGKAPGTVAITATADGVTGSSNVTVTP